jgi:ParB-like chromosome segregation protein Spo0J
MVKHLPIGKIKPNKDNPRFIRDEKFTKLVKSLREFPDMAQLRPLIVNAEMVVLGGNMRLKAMQELKWEIVPVIVADTLTPEQQREFTIKDNLSYGENDWEMLANEWDAELLTDWGLDIPNFDGELPEDNPEDSDPNALIVEGTPEQLEDLLTELNTRGFKVKFK